MVHGLAAALCRAPIYFEYILTFATLRVLLSQTMADRFKYGRG